MHAFVSFLISLPVKDSARRCRFIHSNISNSTFSDFQLTFIDDFETGSNCKLPSVTIRTKFFHLMKQKWQQYSLIFNNIRFLVIFPHSIYHCSLLLIIRNLLHYLLNFSKKQTNFSWACHEGILDNELKDNLAFSLALQKITRKSTSCIVKNDNYSLNLGKICT
jgi:hypothetical protein